jgi:CubicO group peptidase (beta-lactamase class C family)
MERRRWRRRPRRAAEGRGPHLDRQHHQDHAGALILQLADESRLSLDDPVSRWLAPHPHVNPGLTLRQLLSHTNGLDNYTESPALGASIAARPARVFTPEELLAFVGPPHFAPGARTEYTNTAFLLLGEVAQEATGRPFLDLLHERLWDPLRLTAAFLPGFELPPAPVPRALGRAGLVAPLDQMSVLSTGNSAFGLMASARTVARWGHELFTGSVISPRMQEEMRRLVPAAGNMPGESGAGLGIRGYSYLGRPQLGHKRRRATRQQPDAARPVHRRHCGRAHEPGAGGRPLRTGPSPARPGDPGLIRAAWGSGRTQR